MIGILAILSFSSALYVVAAQRKPKGKQHYVPKVKSNWEVALKSVPIEKARKKILFTETGSGRYAMELYLSPHQEYPPHIHMSSEWIYCLQGEISDQFSMKYEGDFFYNENCSPHFHIKAGFSGCTVLVVKDKGVNIPKSMQEIETSSEFNGNQFTYRASTSKDPEGLRKFHTEPESGRNAFELILKPFQSYQLGKSNEWIFCLHGDVSDEFGTKVEGDFFHNENTRGFLRAGENGCNLFVVKDK